MRLTAFQISMQRPISRHNAQHSLQAKKGNLWLKPSSVKHIYQNSTFEKSLLVTTKLLISGKMGAGYLLRCWMIEPSELTLQTFLTSTERQDTKISPADDAILKQTHIIFWLNQGIQWPLWMKVMESWKSPLSINIKLITVLICSDEQWQKNALHHSESAHPHCNYQGFSFNTDTINTDIHNAEMQSWYFHDNQNICIYVHHRCYGNTI